MKQKLREYYGEVEADYDPEEIVNVLEVLEEQDENLKGLSKISATILCRLINDNELIDEIEQCIEEEDNSNPFD